MNSLSLIGWSILCYITYTSVRFKRSGSNNCILPIELKFLLCCKIHILYKRLLISICQRFCCSPNAQNLYDMCISNKFTHIICYITCIKLIIYNILCRSYKSVSYTHLDVYKRQVHAEHSKITSFTPSIAGNLIYIINL